MNQRKQLLGFGEEVPSFYLARNQDWSRASNLSELRYYLEEMYQIDLLSPNEKEIYERYQLSEEITYREWLFIQSNMHTYYKLKF
ncbi:hypothetical protein R6U77_18215 [Lysinibacillus louembei]|uniref:Uncharacterized protein n=1 Tax=Lysinibacillus louembei TaxID=1470088 RepID=A0ABZ0RUA3_9BACI|nr:hypothetical protein [Lysinibacillus louembei]WPK11803.1 hypothetical protein R6U77_18215 [Lysinibacillus louembei]